MRYGYVQMWKPAVKAVTGHLNSTIDGDTEHLQASRPRIMNACVLRMRKRLSTLNSDFSRTDIKAVLRQKSVNFFFL